MMCDVKFNTKEKAEECFNCLGDRAVDIWSVSYKSILYGWWVHYWPVGDRL